MNVEILKKLDLNDLAMALESTGILSKFIQGLEDYNNLCAEHQLCPWTNNHESVKRVLVVLEEFVLSE